MVFQVSFFSEVADRVEVQRKGIRFREQHTGQLLDPTFKQFLLLVPRRAIRVIGGETLFWQDVHTGEQCQCFIAIEVVDVAEPFLVDQLEREQAQQCIDGWYHLRTGVIGFRDKAVKTQLSEQGQEQEDARVPGDQPASLLKR